VRSSLQPVLFAGVYYIVSVAARYAELSPDIRAELLIAAPKVVQGVFAAFTDYFTWKWAERVYGQGSRRAWATVRQCKLSSLSAMSTLSALIGPIPLLFPVGFDCLQPMAMVLFDPDTVQLPRNNTDCCCALYVAMAAVVRRRYWA